MTKSIQRAGGGIAFLLILITCITLSQHIGNKNYRNSDATWHTLLTLKCYDETSYKIHKFLPIVTLGDPDDKNISWGDTIPDKYGNYYYTSFSPAGYFLPYFFIKALHLPINETSLYIFNIVLLLITCFIFKNFIIEVFQHTKISYFLGNISMILIAFAPEIIHGMGKVYWHQSIMQMMLLLQLYTYVKLKDSRIAKYIFYALCIINPYIEWTGYVANVGYIIAEILIQKKKKNINAFRSTINITLCTGLAFLLFSYHYLLVVDADLFFKALYDRFFQRNFTANIPFTNLLIGYYYSFQYLWWLLILLILLNIIKHRGIKWIKDSVLLKKKLLVFVMIFPVFENIVMLEHAISYSYDRMKLIYFIVLLICDQITFLIEKRTTLLIIETTMAVLITSCLNFHSYVTDRTYTWDASWRESNDIFANYCKQYTKKTSIMGHYSAEVRGYTNLLFDRGIYEYINLMKLKDICLQQEKQYALLLLPEKITAWAMYEYYNVIVYDSSSMKYKKMTMDAANNIIEKYGYLTTELSDENWTNGISNTFPVLLFERNEQLLNDLLTATKLISGNRELNLQSYDYDDKWIRITVSEECTDFGFPNIVEVK